MTTLSVAGVDEWNEIVCVGAEPGMAAVEASADIAMVVVQNEVFVTTPSTSFVRQESWVSAISICAFWYPGTRVSAMAIPHSMAELKSGGLGIESTYPDL
jgi:hypothetical protein